MNNLTIPPSPNWYEPNIAACASDNTLIYGARNDLIILLNPEGVGETAPPAAEVKIIPRAHSQKITSVSINRNWGQPDKLAVSASEDNILKLWNIDTFEKKLVNNVHLASDSRIVGVSFAGDERIVSAVGNGNINVWNITLNQNNLIKDLFGFKVNITCLSPCPHATWLTAFGLKSGLVIVTDLRKNGSILYKLRGHDKSIISLSWCPVPVNIFPASPKNSVKNKSPTSIAKVEEVVEEKVEPVAPVVETPQKDYSKLWSNLKHADDDEVAAEAAAKSADIKDKEKPVESAEEGESFLQTCLRLKAKIMEGLKPDSESEDDKTEDKDGVAEVERPVLEAKRKIKTEVQVAEEVEVTKDEVDVEKIEEKEESAEEPVKATLDQVIETVVVFAERTIPKNKYIQEEPRKEFLLASSSRENKIYIWRAGTDGRMQTFLSLPTNRANSRHPKHPEQFITINWVAPTMLLSSNRHGELVYFTLPKPQDVKEQMHVIHRDHNTSNLFSISAPTTYSTEYNWMQHKATNAWTIGQDRSILNTSLNSARTNLASYPTFGGGALVIKASPLDPNRLALGLGGSAIHTWDLTRPHRRVVPMQRFYQKIQSKVTALAWHPTVENKLAYGTIEGRVGVLDVTNKSKSPTLLTHFYKSEIYGLEWGPINGNVTELGLYVVSERHLMVFDTLTPQAEPLEVDTPDNTVVYFAGWKPDYSKLYMSTKQGNLIIYNKDLNILSTAYLQQKFGSFMWHPNSSVEDSKYFNQFAAISNVKGFFICKETADNGIEVVASIIAGHCDNVTAVAWNPFDEDVIVSVGTDGVAQVWNVETKTVLSTFVNPTFEAIISVIWSPIEANFIIMSTKDAVLRIWDITEHLPQDEKDVAQKRKLFLKELISATSPCLAEVEKPVEEIKKTKKANKNVLLPFFYTPKENAKSMDDLRRLLKWKESGEVESISATNGEGDKKHIADIFDVFGKNTDMLNLLNLNGQAHKDRGKYAMYSTVALWKGDISSAVKEAIEQKRVTPWIISLAPMVSPVLWKEACEVYANQLLELSDSDPMEIATYFLACHKIQEAIKVLCDSLMFREALSLTKARSYADDDEIIAEVISKWAEHSVVTGAFEIAAQCYIYLGKFEKAASVLFRRSDVDVLAFAMELAEKSGNVELHKAVAFRYDAFKREVAPETVVELPDLPTKTAAVLMSKDLGKDTLDIPTTGLVDDKNDNDTEALNNNLSEA